MKNFIKFLSFFILISCSNNSIEKEMKSWCDCEQKQKVNPNIRDSCNKIMFEISTKYEFDPEAVEIIRNKVIECN